MSTQEIPREEWSNFFDSFSRQHEGWLATLEVFDDTTGAQPEAEELPFEGISLDSNEVDSNSVVISFGRSPAEHVTHTIQQAKNLWLQQTLKEPTLRWKSKPATTPTHSCASDLQCCRSSSTASFESKFCVIVPFCRLSCRIEFEQQ